jgi:hypothetical protein
MVTDETLEINLDICYRLFWRSPDILFRAPQAPDTEQIL